MIRLLLTIIVTLGLLPLWSQQPSNDECLFAIHLDNVDQYCSDGPEFNNIGGSPDPQPTNTCFLNFQNGVWFSFIPREPAVLIQVFSGPRNGGTIENPQIVIFEGCGQYLECSPGKDRDSDELTQTELIIGQLYYIMVESPAGQEGSFELCINDFVAPKPPESDCDSPVVLCDKSSFSIENLNSAGNNTSEVTGSCIQQEFASSWYTWTCDESGTLTFELIPNNNAVGQETDDLDFAIYELPNGPNDCTGKQLVRCMASGANVGQPLSAWIQCNGPTGLRDRESDIEELPGCLNGSNNYIAPLDMESGKSYGLVINNFSRSGLGFSIDFGGSGTFLGPEPDFDLSAVQAFECDKTIVFNNLSQSLADSIISYRWNFGVGASQPFLEGEGPHDIVYESFGDKLAALTVETKRGCQVTKVLEFFVEPCCADTSTLEITAGALDVLCGGEASGEVFGDGRNGAPQYAFSLDGENYQPNPRFVGLPAGAYTIYIQDAKGCVNFDTVVVAEPEVLRAFAGGDTTITLGETTQLSASFSPPDRNVSVTWVVDDSLSCTNCLDPVSKTPGTTTYIIQVEDSNGCTAFDTVTINVDVVRRVYAPNVFSPNEDGNNDVFALFGGPEVIGVDELRVFDRWGNLIYENFDLPVNNPTAGWDGTFGDQLLNPAVFTWVAQVRFLDRVVLPFSGDITLVR
jgi:gliding motility-associated-like protein